MRIRRVFPIRASLPTDISSDFTRCSTAYSHRAGTFFLKAAPPAATALTSACCAIRRRSGHRTTPTPIERLDIQSGLSYLYPQSTVGRTSLPRRTSRRSGDTPLSTRFNVAAFGVLGYELELKYMTHAELKELRGQIEFYKAHRKTFQFGRFYRFDERKDNKVHWQGLLARRERAHRRTFSEALHGLRRPGRALRTRS